MRLEITQEERNALLKLSEDIDNGKEMLIQLSKYFWFQLRINLLEFVISYKEYSLTNIRDRGLGDILMERAIRFFKLGNEKTKKEKSSRENHSNKRRTRKFDFRKMFKRCIYYPFMVIFFLCKAISILIKTIPKKIKKSEKPKRNILI